MWVAVLQETTAHALKQSPRKPPLRIEEEEEEVGRGTVVVGGSEEGGYEVEEVPDAMSLILGVPGNRSCADCSSTGKKRMRKKADDTLSLLSLPALPLQWWSGPA